MGKKFLFSPIGGTDPIKYERDGSMLHICRHYQPDIVYLYLSHEMMEYHRKDNRYIDALQRLGEHLHHSFEVRLIERDDLIEVQQYDFFFQDFREEIRKIEQEVEKGDELLINMSSGTPAMKNALLTMATLAEYRFQPIQVSTPENQMNERPDFRKDYDPEICWEINKDNEEGEKNRCVEVQCFNLVRLLKIETIKKHILAYDYAAALAVAFEIAEDLPADAYQMIRIAHARLQLNLNQISTLMKGKTYDIYPIKEGDKQKIFEYALILQIKVRKQEYADFVRGITPLAADLLENILKKKCKIRLEDCCTKDKKTQGWMWSRKKLQNMGLLELMDREYNGFKGGHVYSHHLKTIICDKCREAKLTDKISDMISIEGAVRNMAAHEIVSVTENWIKQRTEKTPQQILDIIKYLIVESGIHAKDEHWDSYDKMNEKIELFLRR